MNTHSYTHTWTQTHVKNVYTAPATLDKRGVEKKSRDVISTPVQMIHSGNVNKSFFDAFVFFPLCVVEKHGESRAESDLTHEGERGQLQVHNTAYTV